MGTLYCDAGTGSYVVTTLSVSLGVPADCPADWTSASPSPLLWVGVIADGANYKMRFWDDNPDGVADTSTASTATNAFTGSPLEWQVSVDANGTIDNVSPTDPNSWDGPQNLADGGGVKFKFVPSGGGINPLSNGGSSTSQKKVFCNFW